MAPIDWLIDPHRRVATGLVMFFVLGALAFSFWRFPPPQIGNDEDVFRTVDALFTAVTSRSQKQLDDCDERLKSYREAGTLPKKPAEFLSSVIQQARSGQWEPAAKRLYDFMYGQRGH